VYNQLTLLQAIKDGHCTPFDIAKATKLSLAQVLGAAGILRGDGERPNLICALDGEPWALTYEGAKMLQDLK
jgi:hypothetical protein